MESENKIMESENKTAESKNQLGLKELIIILVVCLAVGVLFTVLGCNLVSLFPNILWMLGVLLLLIVAIDFVVILCGVIPLIRDVIRKSKGKTKKESKAPPKALKIIVAAAVLVSIVVLIFTINNARKTFDDSVSDSYGHSESTIWSEAKDIVSKELKSPSTAKFCTMNEGTIVEKDDKWTVSGYVDAQNSFGTTLRNEFTVVIKFTNKDDYSILSCDIE